MISGARKSLRQSLRGGRRLSSLTQHFASVALVGSPNAGKSTIVNHLVGSKVVATSSKSNTTRTQYNGILSEGTTQLVLRDVPGFVQSGDKRRYDRRLVSAAEAALEGAQVFLFVVDIAKRWGHLEAETLLRVAEAAAAAEAPLLMALNKVDRLTGAHNWHGLAGRHKQRKQREMLLLLEAKTDAVSDAWGGALQVAGSAVEPPCTPIHTTSAVNGDGMPQLKRALQSCAPAGAWQFPAGVVSDRSNEARVHEAIREQLFRHLHKEVPYQARQVNRSWRLNGRGELIIHQDIQLPRAPQVSMLLARGCAALEAVSMGARDTLEGIFNRRVHLFLHVAHKPELVSRGVSVEDDFDANLGQGGVFAPAPAAMFQPSGDAVRLNVEEKHADIQDAMAELRGALGGAPAAGGAGGGAARRVGGLQLQRDAALLGPHAVWRPADN